jgi:hypothetical protein
MSEPSKFASNPFLTATERRHPLMTEILPSTLPKIAAAALEDLAFVPSNDALIALAGLWIVRDTSTVNAEAFALSSTQAFETKMDSLTRKPNPDSNSPLTEWCLIIEPVAPVGSTLYRHLLPQGRETLTAGTYETRLNALDAFRLRLSQQVGKPTLLALALTVLAFHSSANGLRDTQGTAAQALSDARDLQEALRVTCAAELYAMVGVGMQVWKLTPERVDELFNVELLRDPELELPLPVADTLWTPGTRTLSTTELPDHTSMLEAWRLGPGGAPERIAVGERDAITVVIPAAITFDPGKTYQLWLVAKNSRGSSPAGPVQTWLAP